MELLTPGTGLIVWQIISLISLILSVICLLSILKNDFKNHQKLICTFDAISCRFGFMFFPDMLLAAKEMARVLKPGGKIATAVWGIPEKNFWVTAIGGTINRNMQLPVPPPEAPGMFHCAKSGLLTEIFRQARLKNISETEVNGKLNAGTIDIYWTMMTEVAAPFVADLSKADDSMKSKIKSEVYDLVRQKFPDGNVFIDSSALVIYAEK